jgi:hypothetical protein
VRLISNPHTKVCQGALEFNAYLIKNLLDALSKEEVCLTEEEYAACLDMLYLNIKKLARSADLSMQLNQLNLLTKRKIA